MLTLSRGARQQFSSSSAAYVVWIPRDSSHGSARAHKGEAHQKGHRPPSDRKKSDGQHTMRVCEISSKVPMFLTTVVWMSEVLV